MRRWLRTLTTLSGTPRGIAGGFALGLSLSLLPIPFVGMFVALALAPLLRFNLPATYLGTAVINPVTGPLFYFAELWLGLRVLAKPLPTWAQMKTLSPAGWWDVLLDATLPLLLGALLMAVAALALTTPLLWWLTRRWQARRSAGPPDPPAPSKRPKDAASEEARALRSSRAVDPPSATSADA